MKINCKTDDVLTLKVSFLGCLFDYSDIILQLLKPRMFSFHNHWVLAELGAVLRTP